MAGLVWGTGQLVLAGEVLSGQAQFPALGDAISGSAAPFAAAGLALLPRRVTEPLQGPRLACEVLMLTAAGTALAWRLGFDQVLDPTTLEGASGLALVAAELLILSLVFICATREATGSLFVVLAGVTLFVAADLFTMYAVARTQPWPWLAAAVVCLAWPVITAGVLRIPAQPTVLTDRQLAGAEWRRLVLGATVLGLLVDAILAAHLAPAPVDGITLALYAAMVGGFLGREVLRAHQSRRLLGRLSHQAVVDPLTELPNRRALTERLDALPQRHPERAARLNVLTLDLDGFKDVNGRLGYGAGDLVLRAVAQEVSRRAQEWGASAYRLGGDEFAVVYVAAPDQASALAQALGLVVRSAAGSVQSAGPVALTVSVGVASAAGAGAGPVSPSEVVLQSGQALHAAKESGRGRVVVFSEPLAARSQRRVDVERRLREQLARGGVQVHYQLIVSLETGLLVGLEALARWTDEELGPVPPQEFVSVAESCGLIEELGWQILQTAAGPGQQRRRGAGDHPRRQRVVAAAAGPRLRRPLRRAARAARTSRVPGGGGGDRVGPGRRPRPHRPEPSGDRGGGLADRARRLRHRLLLAVEPGTAAGPHPQARPHPDRPPGRAAHPGGRPLHRRPRGCARARRREEGIETRDQLRVAQELGIAFGQGWLWSRAVPSTDLPALLTRLDGQGLSQGSPEDLPAGFGALGPRPRLAPDDRPVDAR